MNKHSVFLSVKLRECRKHAEKIQTALKNLQGILPITKDVYENLTEIQSGFIDQLIFRFSKLQDTLGEKIFPALLTLSGEEVKSKTFIDILNRLEELKLLEKSEWIMLREIRNQIAHEYSDDIQDLLSGINGVYNNSARLIAIFTGIEAFYIEKLSER